MAVSKVARSSSPNLFARQLIEVTSAGNEVASFCKVTGPMPVFCNDKVKMFDSFNVARKARYCGSGTPKIKSNQEHNRVGSGNGK